MIDIGELLSLYSNSLIFIMGQLSLITAPNSRVGYCGWGAEPVSYGVDKLCPLCVSFILSHHTLYAD